MARANETPPFWWEQADWRARALTPAARLYGAVAAYRLRRARRTPVPAPVLCIGNFTVGGSGKTPVALRLAREALAAGLTPGFLSRGYGGHVGRARLVEDGDDARMAGDEPMLLAQAAPVAVGADRAAGARLLIAEGVDFIIMDDGFQSGRILMDYTLVIADGRRGAGNGHVIPAGPLRAPLIEQLHYADALTVIGDGNGADKLVRMAARAAKPVYRAAFTIVPGHGLNQRRVLAFAGIGDPQRFFRTVARAGALVEETRIFPDHHPYSDEAITEMATEAKRRGLDLVTTQKDAVRLEAGSLKARQFRRSVKTLKIDVAFEEPDRARNLIEETRSRYRARL